MAVLGPDQSLMDALEAWGRRLEAELHAPADTLLLREQFDLDAEMIAQIYRRRWAIELFFRWIKQNLRLRSFYGTSPNAVRVQLWTAIIAYLCAAITRHRCGLAGSRSRAGSATSRNTLSTTRPAVPK